MRLVFTALLALALGILPIGTARANTTPEPAAMACHEMMGGAGGADHDDQAPADRMQDCADHCLSQVNSPTAHTRLLGPSLMNAIRAELGGQIDRGKLHFGDPPDPPPPRI